MAPHSSTLAWRIPWTEEPGRLQSMGSLIVGHDWATSLSFSLSCIGEGNGNPLQCSCLENPRDGGAWWAAVYEVAQCRTRLKRLSSSSSSPIRGFVRSWSHLAISVSLFWASQVVLVVKNPPANAGDLKRREFDPWVRKIPWRRAWPSIPVYLGLDLWIKVFEESSSLKKRLVWALEWGSFPSMSTVTAKSQGIIFSCWKCD